MKAGRVNRRRITLARSQRGVVLLIALIMLVAMTLAGIGMMRSVDTGSVIAGNLAFKQSTLNASDAGTSWGFNNPNNPNNSLAAVANSANSGTDKLLLQLDGDQTQNCHNAADGTSANWGCSGATPNVGFFNLPGYYSSPVSPCEVRGQVTGQVNGVNCTATQSAWWTNPANWANAITLPLVKDPVNGTTIATVSYIIHRMCQLPNAPPTQLATGATPNEQLCQTYTSPATGCSKSQLLPCTSTSVFYRITSRSLGARNTATYTQTLVLIGM